MNLGTQYWMTILFTFCRYLSVLMMASGVGFILLGYFIHPLCYILLALWPLLIMWGVVNMRYLNLYARKNGF